MELKTEVFNAGAAKKEITPALGTVINGDFKPHYASSIHDPLYAKALVLQKGASVIAIVVVDICVMPKSFVDDVKHRLQAELDLKFEHILISCTHTHAAGSVAEAYLSSIDDAYSRKLPGLIVGAVAAAIKKLQPAKIAFGKIAVPEHVLCRRYFMKPGYLPVSPVNGNPERVKTNPFGAESMIGSPVSSPDPEVGYLAIQDLSGHWISLLANYSLHYVGDWKNGTISADYFGEFTARLQNKLNAPDDFVGIMSNGTSGDINVWDFSNSGKYPSGEFEKSKFIGEDIAEKVYKSLGQLIWETNADLIVQYDELDILCRKPSASELEEAEKLLAESDYNQIEIDESGLSKIYAREQVLLNEYPESISFPVQVIKIGSGMIGGLGAEIFAETGLWLKKESPATHYFTISLANGNCGYLPTPREFEYGGYETWRSRTSYLDPGAEVLVRQGIMRLMKPS